MSDKTPPQITTGSFVSWANGKGRVDLVVTSGKVPGVDSDVEATSDSPAARVVIWKDGKATTEKIAASTHTLRRIAPLDKDEQKADPAAALVAICGQHERILLDMGDGHGIEVALTGGDFKTAYDRGLLSWPGSDVTALSPTDWALGRAEMLSKAALGEADVTSDADLLNPAHPLHKDAVDAAPIEVALEDGAPAVTGDGEVALDASEVESMLSMIERETDVDEDEDDVVNDED